MTAPTGIDYADWLTPERLEIEEGHWASERMYERYAGAIRRLIRDGNDIRTILEFGAGTGWVPSVLDDLPLDKYVCVDRNPGCVAKAHQRNAQRVAWVQVRSMEIRDLRPFPGEYDLVCGFAVLKHFRVEEWQQLFVQLFASSRFGLFSMPLARRTVDDGIEHTHVLVTEEFLAQAITAAGHRELWRDVASLKEPIFAIGRADG
jgi:predicted RNA methylase